MKTLLGTVLIAIGVAVAIYCGGYLALVCGIVGVIEQIRAPVIDNNLLTWAIVKIIFAVPTAIVVGVVPILTGQFLIVSEQLQKFRSFFNES